MSIASQIVNLDVRLLYWSELQRQKPYLLQTAKVFSRSGDGYLQLGAVLWLALSAVPAYREFAYWLALVFMVERFLYWVLKSSLKRERPPMALPSFKAVITASDKFSFPSGHTSAAFVLVAALAMIDPISLWVTLPWACCVGASRVVLGVHFPSDIIAGATLGLTVTCVANEFFAIL